MEATLSKGNSGRESATISAPSVARTVEQGVIPGDLSYSRWEFLSVIVWDDDPKSGVTSDLEDVEVMNTLGFEGWELVCVVPLARTQVLEMAYPGNTRKLLAYFKRPIQ
jgi:hypothetical protein